MTRGTAGALCLCVAACAAPAPPQDGDPGGTADELVPTQEIPGNFLMRQRLHFRAGDEEGDLDAVIQKHCDELTVIGLTPFGTRAFTIRQRGTQVSAESHAPGGWPFPPRRVLIDVHRIYFLPLPEAPPEQGMRQISHGAEIVQERWESQRLVERSFRRASGDPPGRIVVTYRGGTTRDAPAPEVYLENERHGYSLEVTTLSRSELTCP